MQMVLFFVVIFKDNIGDLCLHFAFAHFHQVALESLTDDDPLYPV